MFPYMLISAIYNLWLVVSSGLLNSYKNVDKFKNVKNIIKPIKYNCKILSCMCLIYYNKWKMKNVNNDFNILKVNSSTLIVENMSKKSLTHDNALCK